MGLKFWKNELYNYLLLGTQYRRFCGRGSRKFRPEAEILVIFSIEVAPKSVGIWAGIVNPIYGCGVKIAPDINPIYAGFERSCPRDSKNVSYVDVGLV